MESAPTICSMDKIIKISNMKGNWGMEVYPWLRKIFGKRSERWDAYNPARNLYFDSIEIYNENDRFHFWIVWE